MMSDTPRTDEWEVDLTECVSLEYPGTPPRAYARKYVPATLCRDLERENATLRQQLAEAEERETMRLAGISTASIGYWKEGESIHPDYDTQALRDVAALYGRYVEASKALTDARQKLTEWAREAHEDVCEWGSYASEYMQEKWQLRADLAKWQARAKGEKE